MSDITSNGRMDRLLNRSLVVSDKAAPGSSSILACHVLLYNLMPKHDNNDRCLKKYMYIFNMTSSMHFLQKRGHDIWRYQP